MKKQFMIYEKLQLAYYEIKNYINRKKYFS